MYCTFVKPIFYPWTIILLNCICPVGSKLKLHIILNPRRLFQSANFKNKLNMLAERHKFHTFAVDRRSAPHQLIMFVIPTKYFYPDWLPYLCQIYLFWLAILGNTAYPAWSVYSDWLFQPILFVDYPTHISLFWLASLCHTCLLYLDMPATPF